MESVEIKESPSVNPPLGQVFNKSFITNLVACSFIGLGFALPDYGEHFKSMGFFAFSGAITNWLAIHMLFEKVPFLYGSGIIPNQFEAFKKAIKKLMMDNFFTSENITKFYQSSGNAFSSEDLSNVIHTKLDYNKIFNGLLESVKESSFGSMLMMFGGVEALRPLQAPFQEKLKGHIDDFVKDPSLQETLMETLGKSGDGFTHKIENIIDARLSELTPTLVKEIVHEMIRKHLGWLVVWGGVFGGLIGLIMSFIH